jgi:hypothetical protein
MTDLPFDPLELMRTNPEAMNVPGGLLTEQEPQKYVGSVPAIAGTLFFNDAHLAAVREAICDCFDAFVVPATPPLTWLFREDPPEGPSKMAYEKAKPLKAMLEKMDEDDEVSFHYTSGKEAHDAGPWEFQVVGLPAWRAKMGRWACAACDSASRSCPSRSTRGHFRTCSSSAPGASMQFMATADTAWCCPLCAMTRTRRLKPS